METINIPISYKGKDINVAGEILRLGYMYKIVVVINEATVTYERDEEGFFRAIADPLTGKLDHVDLKLVQAIGEVLEHVSV